MTQAGAIPIHTSL